MIANPPISGSLEAAVDRGRRRLLALSALRWACGAVAVALAGPVLLLALGTDRFPPELLWVFVFGGVVWAGWRWRQSRPEPYRVAQALDERWGAQDQIATAWYFSSSGEQTPAAAQLQREMALQAATGHEVDSAFPYAWPQAATFAAGLLGLALLLFGVRVAMQPELSFEPPLQHVLFPGLAEDQERRAALEEERQAARADAQDEPQSLSKRAEQAARRESPERKPTPPSEAAGPGDAFQMPEVEGLTIDPEPGDELAMQAKDGAAQGNEPGGDEAAGDEPGTESASAEQETAGDWNQKSSDLLDRLRDAFQDMMEKLGLEQPESAGNQSQEGGEQGKEGSEQPSGEGGEQSSEAGEAGAESAQAEMEGGEPGQGGDPEQAAQGQSAQSTTEEGSQPGQSAGASGSAEGSKELAERMAEQQAALDALEEFYMQRAEEIEGEIMVETSTAEQSVQTPYQASRQTHTDRGGAVTRDEVPLAYQRYIETYFRNLRRNKQN